MAVCEITTRDWTLEEEIPAYVSAGIDALGVYRPKLNGVGVRRAASMLRDALLPAKSMISGKDLTGARQSLAPAIIDAHLRMLDDCECLGVETLVVVPGKLHGRVAEEVEALAVEALSQLAPAASERGVSLAVEPIRAPYFDFVNTLAEAERLVRAVNHPSVGILFDTWHLWDEPGLYETLGSAIDLVRLVHVSDWRQPTRGHDDRLLPGEGVMPLNSLVRHIDSLGYRGMYEVEIFSNEVWASNYDDVLRRCRSWFDGVWQA